MQTEVKQRSVPHVYSLPKRKCHFIFCECSSTIFMKAYIHNIWYIHWDRNFINWKSLYATWWILDPIDDKYTWDIVCKNWTRVFNIEIFENKKSTLFFGTKCKCTSYHRKKDTLQIYLIQNKMSLQTDYVKTGGTWGRLDI